MAKKFCVICNKELGTFSFKTTIKDGVVCSECLKNVGIIKLGSPNSCDSKSLKEIIDYKAPLMKIFKPTKRIGGDLLIDEKNKLFSVYNGSALKHGHELFEYKNLLQFKLLEDTETIAEGGIGRATVGGLFFGGAGAIVGGLTGKKLSGVCKSLKIHLTLKDTHIDTVLVNIISGDTKRDSLSYSRSKKYALEIISQLQLISDSNKQSEHLNNSKKYISSADEIMKFKKLLDEGIITKEEFETKKQQLLELM